MAAKTIPRFPPLGMSPDVWGPIFWTTMHIVTLGFSNNLTKDEQQGAIQFFHSLTQVLPCPICRTHYKHLLETSPVENVVHSRDTLIVWLFDLHNGVNKQLGKSEITFQTFIYQMNALANSGHTKLPHSNTGVLIASLLVGVGIGAAAVYASYKYLK